MNDVFSSTLRAYFGEVVDGVPSGNLLPGFAVERDPDDRLVFLTDANRDDLVDIVGATLSVFVGRVPASFRPRSTAAAIWDGGGEPPSDLAVIGRDGVDFDAAPRMVALPDREPR